MQTHQEFKECNDLVLVIEEIRTAITDKNSNYSNQIFNSYKVREYFYKGEDYFFNTTKGRQKLFNKAVKKMLKKIMRNSAITKQKNEFNEEHTNQKFTYTEIKKEAYLKTNKYVGARRAHAFYKYFKKYHNIKNIEYLYSKIESGRSNLNKFAIDFCETCCILASDRRFIGR